MRTPKVDEMPPSEVYEEHVTALRNSLFGRFSRRNTSGQKRIGGRLSDDTVESIRLNGKEALQELSIKYAPTLKSE